MVLPPVIFAGLAAMFYLGMQRDDPDALPSVRVGGEAPPVVLTQLGPERRSTTPCCARRASRS
jgi:cytochrome c biogenesis protein CcmG, thiol:disulfide interchange protein DsbE